jgi:hypothetical protein
MPTGCSGSGSRFVLTRILGHGEIKGVEEWRIAEECYMCERYTYTLFVS